MCIPTTCSSCQSVDSQGMQFDKDMVVSVDASDIATILHANPYEERTTLLMQKVHVSDDAPVKPRSICLSETDPTVHGMKYEARALELYRKQRGSIVVPTETFNHPLYPWIRGRPDGISKIRNAIVEVKCPLTFHPPRLECIPEMYQHQMQAYMSILQRTSCEYVQYDKWNDRIDIMVVQRDPEWLNRVLPSLQLFRDQVYFYRLEKHRHVLASSHARKTNKTRPTRDEKKVVS